MNLYLVEVYVDGESRAKYPDWTLPVMAESAAQAEELAEQEMDVLYPNSLENEELRYDVVRYEVRDTAGVLATVEE